MYGPRGVRMGVADRVRCPALRARLVAALEAEACAIVAAETKPQ